MERERCAVLGKDRGLDRPDPRAFRAGDQGLEQHTADPESLRLARDVDAVLDHAVIAPTFRRRRERRPADDLAKEIRHETMTAQMRRVPHVPRGVLSLESR